MRKFQTATLLIFIISFSSISIASASAEILNPRLVHAIMANLSSIYGKTYPLQVDNKTYDIYYGFNVTYAVATNISLLPEHNSMQIALKNVTQSDAMWIQFPQNLISADKGNFVLYIDKHEKQYELATSDHSTIIGFMVPANANLVEIQGTRIIPEFPVFSSSVLMASFMIIVFLNVRIRK